jgi:hypothetical protein
MYIFSPFSSLYIFFRWKYAYLLGNHKKTSLTPTTFYWGPVPSQDNEKSCICVNNPHHFLLRACTKSGQWTVMYLCVNNPHHFLLRACTKSGQWEVMYLCVKRVNISSVFSDFYTCITFWIVLTVVFFLCFILLLEVIHCAENRILIFSVHIYYMISHYIKIFYLWFQLMCTIFQMFVLLIFVDILIWLFKSLLRSYLLLWKQDKYK